jgi:hypothetical protein
MARPLRRPSPESWIVLEKDFRPVNALVAATVYSRVITLFSLKVNCHQLPGGNKNRGQKSRCKGD